MADLFADYVAESPALMAFYAGPARALFEHPPHAGRWPGSLAEALGARGDEAVIVTGQQPGLFSGPLYTVYKAITAVLAAERIALDHGVPCVPVFWVAGDDHDFEEVRAAHVLSRRHRVETLRCDAPPGTAGHSLYRMPLPPEAHRLVDAAQALARGSEFAPQVAGFLHAALDEAASFSDWMARIVARLFQGTPLRVFAPDWPSARRTAAPVFARELEDPLATTRAVNAAGARLEALGYGAQVVKGAEECAFFLEEGGRRCKVLFEDGHFVLPEAGRTYAREELAGLLAKAPERFTANVALRCVVQQVLFPTAAYVAGPGELAYWAQLKEVFARHGQRMPLVYPRLRATLTDAKLNALLERLCLAPENLALPENELVDRALRATDFSPERAVLDEERAGIADAVAHLRRRLAARGPAAAALGSGFERRVGAALDRLDRGLLHHDRARTATVRDQVARLQASLAPGRKPQERVLNVLSFLFEHGWGLVPRLMDRLELDRFETQEIDL